MNTITSGQIIGHIVAHDYKTASVFKKYEIDFCCQGGRTIAFACEQAGLDPEKVVRELNTFFQNSQAGHTDYNSWDESVLSDHIEQQHHRFVRQSAGDIQAYLAKICAVHGVHHPELYEIKELFSESVEDLLAHMESEELLLFPYARDLQRLAAAGESAVPVQVDEMGNALTKMQEEHDEEGNRFRRISALTSNYSVPPDGCNTYAVTMQLLKAFEEDLHLHIHLENNILFPKIKEREHQLSSH